MLRKEKVITMEREKQEAWELAKQLVQIDSSDPGAYEEEIGLWITDWFKKQIADFGGQLADQIQRQFHIPAQDGGSISSGLSLALTLCSPEDVICVFGSLYQAGIVREFFLGPARVEAPLNGIELEVTK